MSNKVLYAAWGVLFILTAALGFIPEPEGPLTVGMTVLSILFFVPGFCLLYRGEKKPVLILSIVSLVLTLLCLLLNVWSVGMTADMGEFLYVLLGLVSTPMYCSRFWLLSLFGWACLLMGNLMKLPGVPEKPHNSTK